MSRWTIPFVDAPSGTLLMGSTMAAIEECVAFWSRRLVDVTYTPQMFRSWIMKEYPRHPVEIAEFAISKYPITNQQYGAFVEETGVRPPASLTAREPENHPVWGVTLEEANAYCAWLSGRMGTSCRLPSEAEWEYAARGSTTLEYPFGQDFEPDRCNTAESGFGRTTPVDRYESSASWLGVCDLAGNVEEWTSSLYSPYPGGAFVDDDLVQAVGPAYPILRGGSFALGGDLARCARRHGPYPAPVFEYRGFRVVREVSPPAQTGRSI
jgi:toxoflavin biosynthesis protein ToxD